MAIDCSRPINSIISGTGKSPSVKVTDFDTRNVIDLGNAANMLAAASPLDVGLERSARSAHFGSPALRRTIRSIAMGLLCSSAAHVGIVSVLAALFVASPVLASPTLTTSVLGYFECGTGCGGGQAGDDGSDSAGFYKTFERTIDRTATGDIIYIPRGTLSANARAAVGSLGVDGLAVADGIASPGLFPTLAHVESDALFNDTLTISSPALTGTVGSISFNVAIDGSFLASLSEQPRDPFGVLIPHGQGVGWSYDLSTGDGGGLTLQGVRHWNIGDQNREPDVSQVLTLLTSAYPATSHLEFIYGTPFDLKGEFHLDMQVYSKAGNYSFMSASFLNSADLNGIAGVYDSQRNPVTDFTITADSGADYTRPFGSQVPEPGTLALVGAGLAGVAALRRRKAT